MSKWTENIFWDDMIPEDEIKKTVENVSFYERFGKYLGTTEKYKKNVQGKEREFKVEKLTTNQLRKFFGEVKRQQMNGYNKTDFILLKPKLAYAVGRAKGDSKIKDFYEVMSNAIDIVAKEQDEEKAKLYFKNFIKIFEAIVAYHKAAEEGKISENN